MVKHIQLTKTCINCGLQKQISAFLQISGPEGTSYGNICSTCRGSAVGKTVVIPESEEHHSSSGATGLKIDSKTKVHIDTEKQQQKLDKTERDIKEAKKEELEKTVVQERKDDTTTAEQKHRQDYLEPTKKDSFLNYLSKKPPPKPITATEKADVIRKTALDQHGILDTLIKEDHTKQDEKSKGIDMVNIDADLSQSHLEKFRSPEFLKAAKAQGWIRMSGIHGSPGQQAKPADGAPKKDDPLRENLKEIFDPKSPGTRRR
jgi:hypothetical protein